MPMYMYIALYAPVLSNAGVHGVYIYAWASALLVLTEMGNAKASNRGTGNDPDPRFFFIDGI